MVRARPTGPAIRGADTRARAGGSTALMVVHGGRPVFQWGDVALKSSVASVRKSVLNVLYGIYVAKGRINLDATLEELDVDDVEGLTRQERQATVADLLKARSGVCHPSVYDTARDRPPRGAHPPGGFWFYNNWDFNALGTIFERQTGETVFDALASGIAVPLQMQDFLREDGRHQGGENPCIRYPSFACRRATSAGSGCSTFMAAAGAKTGSCRRNGFARASGLIPTSAADAATDICGGRPKPTLPATA